MRRGPYLGLMHCAAFSWYFAGPTGVLGLFPFGELPKLRFFINASVSSLSPACTNNKIKYRDENSGFLECHITSIEDVMRYSFKKH